MLRNKFRWIIPLFVGFSTVMACGRVSMSLITPTIENPAGETEAPTATISVPTPVSTTTKTPTVASKPTVTAIPDPSIPTLAYEGLDGNLWVLEAGSKTPRQVTFDGATLIDSDSVTVVYSSPKLSSDGTLLAYRRNANIPNASGSDSITGMWVVDLTTNDHRQILDGSPSGFAWKPGTHVLAYGTTVDSNYFVSRVEQDPDLAEGIRAYDLDSGETWMLVAPERGKALSDPDWSPNGRFLAFEEVVFMEGSGLFTYYDFETQEYISWDEPVGRVSWSPDGSLLTYARHTYAPTGEERLYLRARQGSEQPLGPDYDGPAYATNPVFSPEGDRIAYLVYLDGPDTQKATVMVLDLESGEPKPLGQFEGVWELIWAPDGSHVLFCAGPWQSPLIVAINVLDGNQTMLVDGRELTLAGE